MIKAFYIACFVLFSYGALAQPTQTKNIIVSGPSSHLVETVKDIYKRGGNIFDAAIAGAFTLSVTHPYFVSLGCGGLAVLQNSSGVQALDFREIAPTNVTEDFYVKNKLSSQRTGTSVGVPGFVAGLWAIHQKYGSLPWSRLVKPAIKLADKGFIVSGEWLEQTKGNANNFNLTGKRIFYYSNGKPYLPGEYLQQKKLAEALILISRKNKTLFYDGLIGQDIVKTIKANNGVMSLEDLKNYKVRWLKPLEFPLGDYQVFSMPLPSSGGVILARAAHLMKQQNLHKKTLYSVSELHLIGEILSFAFRPRNKMGDFPNSSRYLNHWLSPKKLQKLGNQISMKQVKKLPILKDTLDNKNLPQIKSKISVKESNETTHFSIINNKNEAISMTLTLNGRFGSFVVSDKYGIVLNNQMDDFNTRPGKPNQFGLIQGTNNKIKTGRRPLSSMSPTIVKKKDEVVMALGAAGGPMIISAVFQILYRHLVRKLDLDKAVQFPRVHHQFLPRTLFVEQNRFSPVVLQILKKRGHKIAVRDFIAEAHVVSKNEEGLLEGAFDSRGEGATGGF